MKRIIWLGIAVLSCLVSVFAQQPEPAASAANAVVPTLVRFSGTLADVRDKGPASVIGVTFCLYKDSQGGAPLWMETQNVQFDKTGHYSVMLGSTTSRGLPTEVFMSGDARWLGVQPEGQAEQPRVLLLSVPYALKAGDAQTIGGLPPSAFVLASPPAASSNGAASAPGNLAASLASSAPTSTSSNVTTTGGTPSTIPMFTTATNVQNSILTQTGATAINVSGRLNLSATGTATAALGFNSRPLDFVASVFNGTTSTPVAQTFQWQAEPVGNNTTNARGSLNLLFAQGSAKPAETGLNIASNGQIRFANGQTFPGTITGVTAGADLTGGGTSGTVTLNLDTTKVPQLATNNTFTGNQTVNGNVSVVGGHISVGGSRALSCTRSCGAIGSIPNGGTSLYSTGAVVAPAGYSLTGCSAYWASSTACSIIQYPTTANITALDDGAGACHALGYNGSGGTLASCACVTACELP